MKEIKDLEIACYQLLIQLWPVLLDTLKHFVFEFCFTVSCECLKFFPHDGDLKNNMNELCFLINKFIFKHDKKVKLDESMKYYCHCDRNPDGCSARAIVIIQNCRMESYEFRKDRNGHSELIMDVNARKFMGSLEEAARKDPAKSARQLYDLTI